MDDDLITAQICLNGHVMTSSAEDEPHLMRKFCQKCGKQTITTCLHCEVPILGNYNYNDWFVGPYFRPNNCHNCGQPYPWVEAAISAARELAGLLEHVSEKDKEALKAVIPDLIYDSPQTKVAAIKFKQIVGKASSESLGVFKEVLAAVIAETAKRMLFP